MLEEGNTTHAFFLSLKSSQCPALLGGGPSNKLVVSDAIGVPNESKYPQWAERSNATESAHSMGPEQALGPRPISPPSSSRNIGAVRNRASPTRLRVGQVNDATFTCPSARPCPARPYCGVFPNGNHHHGHCRNPPTSSSNTTIQVSPQSIIRDAARWARNETPRPGPSRPAPTLRSVPVGAMAMQMGAFNTLRGRDPALQGAALPRRRAAIPPARRTMRNIVKERIYPYLDKAQQRSPATTRSPPTHRQRPWDAPADRPSRTLGAKSDRAIPIRSTTTARKATTIGPPSARKTITFSRKGLCAGQKGPRPTGRKLSNFSIPEKKKNRGAGQRGRRSPGPTLPTRLLRIVVSAWAFASRSSPTYDCCRRSISIENTIPEKQAPILSPHTTRHNLYLRSKSNLYITYRA